MKRKINYPLVINPFLNFIYATIILIAFGCSSTQKISYHESIDIIKIDYIKKPIQQNLISVCGHNSHSVFSIKVKSFQTLNENKNIISAQPIGGEEGIIAKIVYPELAKRAEIEGIVVLEFEVNEKGLTQNLNVIKGIGGYCEESVIQSIQATRFIPSKLKSKPIKSSYRITIQFQFPPELKNKEIILPMEFN